MKDLSKRKYPALGAPSGGQRKWFTGWAGNTHGCLQLAEHETRKLRLQFVRTEKGMSSATAIFKDEEDFEYEISFGSLEKILILLHHKRTDYHRQYDISETRIHGSTWIEGTFMQIKRGQNYFIEPVEVRNE